MMLVLFDRANRPPQLLTLVFYRVFYDGGVPASPVVASSSVPKATATAPRPSGSAR